MSDMKLSLILEAKTQQFKQALTEARAETERLGTGGKSAATGIEATGKAADKAAAGIKSVGKEASGAAPAVKTTGEHARTASEHLTKTGQAAEKAGQGLDGLGKKASVMQQLSAALGKVFAAIVAADVAKNFIQTADAMTQLDGKIKLATTSAAGFARVKQSLIAIANETGVSVADAGTAFSRLSGAVTEAGGSTQDTLNIVKAFGLAAKISGASATEASNAMIQLGQGMAAGTLRGDELNSVLEAAPRFAKALADSMGVPVGSLKSLAEAGKITAQEIIKVAGQMKVLEAEAGAMGNTVSGAVTRLQNAWSQWVGNANDASGVNGKLAESIDMVARNFDSVMRVMAPLEGAFTALKAIASPFVNILTSMVGEGEALKVIFAGVGIAIAAMLGPIGLAVAGFTVMYAVMERIQGWMGADKIREATKESQRLAQIYEGMVPLMNKLNEAGLSGMTLKLGEIQKAAIAAGASSQQVVAIAEAFAQKALAIHAKLKADQTKLDELYARKQKILAGEIEQTEKERVEAQIKEIQKLKAAREQDLQKALSDLERYRAAASAAYARAADAQLSTADKIREIRRRDMSEVQQQADIEAQANEKIILAKQKLAQAADMAAQGNVEGAEKAAQAAIKFASQAESLGSGLDNTGKAIGIVGAAGDVLAKSEQAVGRANDSMAQSAARSAEDIKRTIGELDGRLKEMETKARLVKIEADITEVEKAVQAGQSALDGLMQKTPTQIVSDASQALSEIGDVSDLLAKLDGQTATTYVVTEYIEKHSAGGPAGGVLKLARGGKLPGYGGGDRISALLEAGEYVVRKERASRFGALVHMINTAPLSVLNKLLGGLNVQRFAVGGPVMPNLAMPALSDAFAGTSGNAPSRDTVDVNFNIGRQKFSAQTSRDQAMGLARALQEISRG
jgi:tape measure domain-containing protein